MNPDQLGTVGYRRLLGRGAQRHRDIIRLVFCGGTPRARFEAATYLRGVGVPGAVVETDAQARQCLIEQGIAA